MYGVCTSIPTSLNYLQCSPKTNTDNSNGGAKLVPIGCHPIKASNNRSNISIAILIQHLRFSKK